MLNAILFALYQSCTIIISVDCNQQNTPSLASPSLTVAAKNYNCQRPSLEQVDSVHQFQAI